MTKDLNKSEILEEIRTEIDKLLLSESYSEEEKCLLIKRLLNSIESEVAQ
jgi:hypothetical protein